MNSRILALLLSLAAGAAGCLGGGSSAPGAVSPGGDASGAGNATNESALVLYTLDEIVVGASPTAPGGGPVVEALPVAKVDVFTVPEGIGNLSFAGEAATGTGSGRIDVHDPTGALVWSSAQNVLVGAPGVVGLGVSYAADDLAPETWAAGDYEVRYYVAGAMQALLEVTGTPVAPAAP